MTGALPTGTVTFLFTDIEGSTRLLHALGPDAYAAALAEHRRLLRRAFAEHGGVEVDTQGDAFFVAFPTAPGAAAAALDVIAALREGPVRVRIGLHTGTPLLAEGGYVGADVHRGARIAALAHGNQVVLSEPTRALLAADAEVIDLGPHRIKDFDLGVRVFQLGGDRFPPLRTPGSVNLPAPATRFLGREGELLAAIEAWIRREPRVLTVVGPGGTGKTRFAIELTRLLAEDAEGGTVFVPLAPLRDAGLVLPAIAERLGAPAADAAAIATRIGEKRTHVLLDNVEQLLPGAAGPLAELVAAAPALRLVITSREPLRIAAETQLDLPPLIEDDAVELFLERARAVRPGIEASDAVVELCERLDRLPLAIELAAARMRLLEPDQLLARLSGALDLLTGTRDADDRHATLRATISWSYELLEDEERRVFASLAVFRSGWTLEAAETVCRAEIDAIASLLDKSLVRRRIEADGGVRFWMLETIRTFARECLQELPDRDDEVHKRHAEHVLEIARAARLSSEDQGRGAPPEHERVLAERDEVRAALDWAEAHDRELAAEIVVALEEHWVTSAPSEGWGRVENLLDEQGLSAALTARLLRLRGGLVLFLRGAREEAETCYREALDLFDSLGDDDNVVALLARFAVLAGYWDDPDDVRRLVTEVRELNRTVDNPMIEPQMLSTLSSVARREGDVEEALDLCRASVAAARACGFRMWMLWQLDGQLELELKLGLLDEAETTGRDALDLATSLDDRRLIRSLLTGFALIALRRGERERAGSLWGVVAELEREDPLLGHDHLFIEFATPLRESEDPRFLAAVEAGSALSLAGAVALALDAAQTLP